MKWRTARRSGWAAALAAVLCALAGTAIVGGRAGVAGAPAADARATAAAARPSPLRRPSARERAALDLTRRRSRARTAREEGAASADDSEHEASDVPLASGPEPSAVPEPGSASAEDRALDAPVRAPKATRRPAPAVPDPPEPPLDPDDLPAPDAPGDFERPSEAASRPPWAPPL
jgi:hypothetical protein